jgi:sialate O-acetylesterase
MSKRQGRGSPRWAGSRPALEQLTALVACALALVASSAPADVKVPAIFGHHMAVQQGAPLPVWGTAAPGEQVTVTLAGKSASTTAGADGRWKATLPPVAAGEGLTLTVSGKNTLAFTNVVAGEVWLCSGQSNMVWPGRNALEPEKESAAANFPKIRFFHVKMAPSPEPLGDVEGQWVECGPLEMSRFSAVAYFFGRELHRSLGTPVGLVLSAVGGTPIQAWTRRAALEAEPAAKESLEDWDARAANPGQAQGVHKLRMAQWEKAVAKAKAEGRAEPPKPHFDEPGKSPRRPSNLWNGMIAPLVPYAIRGVIWYQGENNAAQGDAYAKLFPAMIRDWRAQWGEGEFPFLFVQLANYMERKAEPADSHWARLREAQLKTLSVTNTGMAVAIDVGGLNIHPRNKQDVGRRLAAWALHFVYGKADVVPSGPLFEKMTVEGDKARLSFRHVGGGLVSKGEGEIKGFAVAGADRKFAWASARIDGDTVVVSSPEVKAPVAVRYGWADNPEVSLSNRAGLPASPFRTDDWPCTLPSATRGKGAAPAPDPGL